MDFDGKVGRETVVEVSESLSALHEGENKVERRCPQGSGIRSGEKRQRHIRFSQTRRRWLEKRRKFLRGRRFGYRVTQDARPAFPSPHGRFLRPL